MKLQVSNKNLLQKVQQLAQEKDGINIHLQPESNEIWPPEMEITLIKEEFRSKEIEWKNALSMAQIKYNKMKERCRGFMMEVREKEKDIEFYQERADVDESDMIMLRGRILEQKDLIEELGERERERERDEVKQGVALDSLQEDTTGTEKVQVDDEKLTELQNQVQGLEKHNAMAKEQLQELGAKWKSRREEMQQLMQKEQDKIRALQERLSEASAEKSVVEIKLEQQTSKALALALTLEESESLRNSTESSSGEKEELAKIRVLEEQLSKSSSETKMVEAKLELTLNDLESLRNSTEHSSVEKEQKDKIRALQEQLSKSSSERSKTEEKLEQTLNDLKSLRNSTEHASVEKEGQNAMAKEQLEELGAKWKNRLGEMQQLMQKEQDKIRALQKQLSESSTEKSIVEAKLEQTLNQLESLRNSTEHASLEKEELAKQLSTESLEIATAAVRQAEEKEIELQKKLNRAQKQLHFSEMENTGLKDKLTELELDGIGKVKEANVESRAQEEKGMNGQIEDLKRQLASANARYDSQSSKEASLQESLSKELRQHSAEMDTERLKWDVKLSEQQKKYDSRVEELESEIKDLMEASHKGSEQLVDTDALTLPGNAASASNVTITADIEMVPIRQKRLGRLFNRVKSIWKKK